MLIYYPKVLNSFVKNITAKGFFQFQIIINVLVSSLSDSFEYLCYPFPAIKNMLILTVRGLTLVVRI